MCRLSLKKPGYGGREVTLIELEAVEALLVLKSGERFGIALDLRGWVTRFHSQRLCS
jgi:hypothetical protein